MEVPEVRHLSPQDARKEGEDACGCVEVPSGQDELANVVGEAAAKVKSCGESVHCRRIRKDH